MSYGTGLMIFKYLIMIIIKFSNSRNITPHLRAKDLGFGDYNKCDISLIGVSVITYTYSSLNHICLYSGIIYT